MQPLFGSFLRHTGGGTALIFSICLPVLLGGTAIAIDSANLVLVGEKAQAIVDATALATAKEIYLNAADATSIIEAGESRVETLLSQDRLGRMEHSVTVEVDQDAGTARVTVSVSVPSLLPVSVATNNPVVATAEAGALGAMRLCVLAMNPADPETLRVKEVGQISAADCTVQSNSIDPRSIHSETGGSITARLICSSGGVSGPENAFAPEQPETDCPAISDPLGSRAPPQFDGCDHDTTFRVPHGTQTVYPGVYCKGLVVSNGASVTLEPGIYVIKGGKFSASQNSVVRGENVHFYFADDGAWFDFADSAIVELSAPKDGPMAGILFMESRDADPGRNFSIGSSNVKKLIGTIYLPKGTLNVFAKAEVAAESAYTVIIARKLDLKAAHLVINTDYDSTDVPVPGSIRGLDNIRLTH